MVKTRKGITLGIVVIALLIISIAPLALGERVIDLDQLEKFSGNKIQGKAVADAKDKEIKNYNQRESEANGTEEKIKNSQKLQEQLNKVKSKLEKVQEKYEKVKEDYNQNRGTIKDLKNKAQCKENSSSCTEKKNELKKGVFQHLAKTAELIDKSLLKLIDMVNNSNSLTDQEKTEAIASLNDLEAKVTMEKEKVQNSSLNATNAELREAITNLKHVWQEVKQEQHKVISLLISSKLQRMSNSLDAFATSMQKSIDDLTAQGADVSELKVLLEAYNFKVQAMKAGPATEAMGKLQEIKDILREFKNKEKEIKDSLSSETSDQEGETTENNATNSTNEEIVENNSIEG